MTAFHKTDYYPFGLPFKVIGTNYNRYLFSGKEIQDQTIGGKKLMLFDFGARNYDPTIARWFNIDPALQFTNPYTYCANNPIRFVDPDGKYASSIVLLREDWIEREDKIIWDESATSDEKTKEGDKYLGKNVVVATHNRDADLNETINSATFELYLESDKSGPTAIIKGNTIPADVNIYGTLAEGIYPARYTIYKNDGALLINGGKDLSTVKGNPNNKKNFYKDGTLKPIGEHVIDQVLLHKGNFARKSLFTRDGYPISAGCQTGGCGEGSLPIYREFIKKLRDLMGIII